MKKILLLSCWFLLGIWTFCRAQSAINPDYFPKEGYPQSSKSNIGIQSPQMWSFMKYGGSTPNLYTGTVSVSIPLYTYSDEDFTLPISLDYASNEYIPNVQASDVGLGWYLNVGGIITRTVRGLPDGETGTPSGYNFDRRSLS